MCVWARVCACCNLSGWERRAGKWGTVYVCLASDGTNRGVCWPPQRCGCVLTCRVCVFSAALLPGFVILLNWCMCVRVHVRACVCVSQGLSVYQVHLDFI